MEAARQMVGGDQNDTGLLASMGVPESMWDKMREKSHLEIWPENWLAFEVFGASLTQWRVGMSGPTGLDYTVLPVVMDLIDVPKESRAECFEGVRVMESEALKVIRQNNGG